MGSELRRSAFVPRGDSASRCRRSALPIDASRATRAAMPPAAPTNQPSAGTIVSSHNSQPSKTNKAPGSTHRRSIARWISRHPTSCERCRSHCHRPSRLERALICLSSAFISHHHGGARRWYFHASNETAVHGGRAGFPSFAARDADCAPPRPDATGSSLCPSFVSSCVLPGPSTWMSSGGVSPPPLALSAVRRCLTTTLLTASKTAFSAGGS